MNTSVMRRLRIAAESGEAAAQFNLGVLYDSRLDDNGYAIKGDPAEAIKWLLAAAERGLPRAQSKLAELYADGPKASGNYMNACAWFLLAAASSRGHTPPPSSISVRTGRHPEPGAQDQDQVAQYWPDVARGPRGLRPA